MTERRPARITFDHLSRKAAIYERVSTERQRDESVGSIAHQRDQGEHALRWGWRPEQIERFAADLGLSGSGKVHRPDWQRVLREVANGAIGIVLAADHSRLTRSAADFETLLGVCQATDTLLAIDGQLVDPNDPEDRFVARIRANFAEFENAHRTERMRKARRAKAKAGYAVSRPPIGYLAVRKGREVHWVKHPDPQVRQPIMDVYTQYQVLGSVRKVLKWFRAHGLNLPAPRRGTGELGWKAPSAGAIYGMLKDPNYCGRYRFGRTERWPPGGKGKPRPTPREEWVEIPGHHPGYVTPAIWDRIQETLRANRIRDYSQPTGRGPALFQGIVRCARCGHKMFTSYSTGGSQRPTRKRRAYRCEAAMSMYGERSCWSIDGETLDNLVASEILQSFAPPDLKAVLGAAKDENAGYDAVCREREAELERARQRVRILKGHLMQVDPEAPLAAAELHRDLEAALVEVKELERGHREAPVSPPLPLSPETVEKIRRLATDVPALWADPATTAQDRKTLVRLAVQEVRVVAVSPTGWEVDISWRGAAVTHHALIRPWAGRFRAQELAAQGLGCAEIAEQLNREGFRRMQTRRLFTRRAVWHLLYGPIWRARRPREKRAGTSAGASLPPCSTGGADGDGASGGSAGPPEARRPAGATGREGGRGKHAHGEKSVEQGGHYETP